jgi:hypothetical protein
MDRSHFPKNLKHAYLVKILPCILCFIQVITKVLEGKNKPVYHPFNDCGEHVVVVNSKHIALLGKFDFLKFLFDILSHF